MPVKVHVILVRSMIALVVAGVCITLLSAVKTKDAKPCGHVSVSYKNGQTPGFLPEKDVLFLIKQTIQSEPVGAPLEIFDLKKIEQSIESHPWVYDAQLYFDNRQTLHVVVDEAVPVARIIDAGGNHFYLDKRGNELPLSTSYRADMAVFTGIPVKRNDDKVSKNLQRVIALGEAISKDSFWLAQTAQVEVLPNGKMELVPTLGNHIVEIGYASRPEKMLTMLKQFYVAAANAGRLNTYSRLIAFYDNQIIGVRTDVSNTDVVNKSEAMLTYQKIVEQNKQAVNASSVTVDSAAGRYMSELPDLQKEKRKEKSKVQQQKTEQIIKIQQVNEDKENKPAEKTEGTTEQKKPKAIMPKLENN
jgi:cell division protein FtsQ